MATIAELRELEADGVIREDCPAEGFWRFSVIKTDALPPELKEEYDELGELRWYGFEG